MTDELARVLRLMDHCEQPVFTFDEVRRWPAGLLDRLVALGLLREIEPAGLIACDNCDEGHVLEPDIREYPDIGAVAVAKCPSCGRVQFSLDRLRQWGAHFDGMASLLASELAMNSPPAPVVPDRIALLGSIATHAGMLDVFLARGLCWDDADTLIQRTERFVASHAPVIIVPQLLPPPSLSFRIRPIVLTLAGHLRWDADNSNVDFSTLSEALRILRPPVLKERWLTVSECATMLLAVVSGIDHKKAMARVSDAASKDRFRTNGEKRIRRRIDRDSFSTWLNEQRERDLAAADEWAEG